MQYSVKIRSTSPLFYMFQVQDVNMSNIANNHNNLKKYIDIQNNIDEPHPRIPRPPRHLPQ